MPTAFTVRTYRRYSVDCPVYYMGASFLGKGLAVEVSREGWRIIGDHPVEVGMTLTLSLLLPDDPVPVKVEKASVRWVRGHTFGIKMLIMQPSEGRDWAGPWPRCSESPASVVG